MIYRIKSFEQLTVWQDAISLAAEVYEATKSFPSTEQFALTNQIRRAISSVSANIAEGFGRQSRKEKLQYYSIAYGSLLETKSFLYLANRLEYLDTEQLNQFLENIVVLQKQINSLSSSIKNHG